MAELDAMGFNTAFRAMGGEGALRLCGASPSQAARAAAAARAEVHRIEAKYSRYVSDSVTGRLHAAAGQGWTPVDAETESLLNYADALWLQSGGLFDITAGVLRHVWDFRSGRLPSPGSVQQCVARVGWDRVQRRPGAVCLPTGMELDFGGIGKEYAADRAAAIAATLGISHGWVNLGGDIAVIDPGPSAHTWHIGIAHPRPTHPGQLLATLAMARGGLATSGDSERFMVVDGRRYCHILNPHTGWPVAHWQSVSVVAASATAAGSLSTIAMLKGPSAVAWLQAQHVQFLAVDFEGRVVHHHPHVDHPAGVPAVFSPFQA